MYLYCGTHANGQPLKRGSAVAGAATSDDPHFCIVNWHTD